MQWTKEEKTFRREVITKIKKGIIMCSVAGAMALSGVAGAASIAKADTEKLNIGSRVTFNYETIGEPNTNNTGFTFRNDKSVAYTDFRYKYNATKVYIYPTVGPTLNYRVHGADSVNGLNVAIRSNAHKVPIGVEASFTNYVHENGNNYARVKMARTVNAAYVDSTFWWSPDSTRNYTIYD